MELRKMLTTKPQEGQGHIPRQVFRRHRSCLLLSFILFCWRAHFSTWQNMWLPMVSKFYTSSFKTPERMISKYFPRAELKYPERIQLKLGTEHKSDWSKGQGHTVLKEKHFHLNRIDDGGGSL